VIFRDRLHVLARPGHPALELNQPGWAQLATFPWVLQMVGRQRMLLERVLRAEKVPMPQQLTESGSVDMIKSIVAGTDALAVLPASAVVRDVREGRIAPIEIVDPLLNRDIAVLFREGVSFTPAIRDLLNQIEGVGLRHSRDQLDLPASAAA